LPFLPLFGPVSKLPSAQMLNSTRFATHGNLTFGVMGGKGGKIAATMWQEVARWAAKTARFGWDAEASTLLCMGLPPGVGGLFASRYAVVQVPAARDGAANMELKYHKRGGVSSG
jgi:hypothetical protein